MRHDGTPVTAMKSYLISLGVGMLVGVIYSLLAVRSPAPPLVALIGLLGMLLGEQIVPVGQQVLSGTSVAPAWQVSQCTQHLLESLPGRRSGRQEAKTSSSLETQS
jgi:XapX domain-containing protein